MEGINSATRKQCVESARLNVSLCRKQQCAGSLLSVRAVLNLVQLLPSGLHNPEQRAAAVAVWSVHGGEREGEKEAQSGMQVTETVSNSK